MIVELRTILQVDLATCRAHVLTSKLLEHIAAPLVVFRPTDPAAFPEQWADGKYAARMLAFGLCDVGGQVINIEHVKDSSDEFILRDNGYGDKIDRWDHWISIRRIDDSSVAYADRVDIRAGLLTAFFWAFAMLFYAHRQRRWRSLIARHFAY